MFANDPLHREGMLQPTRHAKPIAHAPECPTRSQDPPRAPLSVAGNEEGPVRFCTKSILSSAYAKIDNDVIRPNWGEQ
jgi:hypothetical protein